MTPPHFLIRCAAPSFVGNPHISQEATTPFHAFDNLHLQILHCKSFLHHPSPSPLSIFYPPPESLAAPASFTHNSCSASPVPDLSVPPGDSNVVLKLVRRGETSGATSVSPYPTKPLPHTLLQCSDPYLSSCMMEEHMSPPITHSCEGGVEVEEHQRTPGKLQGFRRRCHLPARC